MHRIYGSPTYLPGSARTELGIGSASPLPGLIESVQMKNLPLLYFTLSEDLVESKPERSFFTFVSHSLGELGALFLIHRAARGDYRISTYTFLQLGKGFT